MSCAASNRQALPRFARTPLAFAIALTTFSSLTHAQMTGTAEHQDDVVVKGIGEDNPDFGYVGVSSKTALKMDIPLNETPRSVSVVTREHMDDRASISISDALQYTPGIQTNFYGEDNKQDWFIIRGFKQANNGLYRDGTRVYSNGFYSYQVDPFVLERTEILRGPASSLYGQTPPGGVINLISKRPQGEEAFGTVALETGSYDRRQASLDTGGAFDEDGDIAWRMLALKRANGTQVNDVEADRLILVPSLSIRFTPETQLTLLAEYQKDDSDPYLQFLPGEGTVFAGPNGYISDKTAVGNPESEQFRRTQKSVGYQLEHDITDQLRFEQSARFSQIDVDLTQMYFSSFAADVPMIGPMLDPTGARSSVLRGVSTEYGDADSLNIDNRLLAEISTGDIQHHLMLGLDYQSLDQKGQDYASDPIAADGNNLIPGLGLPYPALDLYNPTYSRNVVLMDMTSQQLVTEADLQTRTVKAHQTGLYAQNHMKIGQDLTLTLGARYDRSDSVLKNLSTGSRTEIDNDEWTTTLGAAYQLGHGLTSYASFAQYFQPINQLDENDQAARPETGQQSEIGLKFQPDGFDGYLNAALYRITQENLARTNPANGKLTQIGEVQSTGVELEAVANITPAFSVVANLTLQDAEIKKNLNTAYVGNQPSQVANKLASAWARYRFLGGDLDGLSIGSGLRYTGDTYGDDTETLKVSAFTLWDATISYRWDNIKLQLAAKNLTDKKYVSTCSGGGYFCWYGNRRNLLASVSYDW